MFKRQNIQFNCKEGLRFAKMIRSITRWPNFDPNCLVLHPPFRGRCSCFVWIEKGMSFALTIKSIILHFLMFICKLKNSSYKQIYSKMFIDKPLVQLKTLKFALATVKSDYQTQPVLPTNPHRNNIYFPKHTSSMINYFISCFRVSIITFKEFPNIILYSQEAKIVKW